MTEIHLVFETVGEIAIGMIVITIIFIINCFFFSSIRVLGLNWFHFVSFGLV